MESEYGYLAMYVNDLKSVYCWHLTVDDFSIYLFYWCGGERENRCYLLYRNIVRNIVAKGNLHVWNSHIWQEPMAHWRRSLSQPLGCGFTNQTKGQKNKRRWKRKKEGNSHILKPFHFRKRCLFKCFWQWNISIAMWTFMYTWKLQYTVLSWRLFSIILWFFDVVVWDKLIDAFFMNFSPGIL